MNILHKAIRVLSVFFFLTSHSAHSYEITDTKVWKRLGVNKIEDYYAKSKATEASADIAKTILTLCNEQKDVYQVAKDIGWNGHESLRLPPNSKFQYDVGFMRLHKLVRKSYIIDSVYGWKVESETEISMYLKYVDPANINDYKIEKQFYKKNKDKWFLFKQE